MSYTYLSNAEFVDTTVRSSAAMASATFCRFTSVPMSLLYLLFETFTIRIIVGQGSARNTCKRQGCLSIVMTDLTATNVNGSRVSGNSPEALKGSVL